MPRGRRASYTRDNSGRFASSPGGGAPKRSTPATRRAATRAGNRLNRDNSGRISGIGRNGATVRGGRLKTAKGNKRATQLTTLRPAGFRGGTIAKGGRGVRGSVARSLAAVRKERAGRTPAAQRPGSLTSTLRGTLRTLARTDAARIRELETITGQRVKPTAAGARAGAEAGARVRATARGGKVAGTLRAGLRELAQSDARTAREMAAIVRDATPKVAGGKGGKAIRGGRAALPAAARKERMAAAKPVAAKQQPQKPSKKPAKPARARRSKPDLSQGSFERRARATEKRAKAAERVVSAIDRFNPANRRLVNRANSLRSAADSYAYYARRGKNDPDFSAADLFKGRSRSSTAPRLTRSEKAAATRRAKADKRFRENVRRMEQDRRR